MRLLWTIALLAPAPAAAQPLGSPARGEELAISLCAACHVVEPGARFAPERLTLPWPEGVPLAFQDIADTRGVSEAALHVWLTISHPNMPNFLLAPEEVEDLTAYILGLRSPEANP